MNYELRQDQPPFWHIYNKARGDTVMCWFTEWKDAMRWMEMLEELHKLKGDLV